MADDGVSSDCVDLISSCPDEILHSILSSMDTIFAIRTSVLSKRWRHVWSETPSLIFDWSTHNLEADLINQTLANYKAPKMTSFQLCNRLGNHIPHIDEWIELAVSRNVENVSLNIDCVYNVYTIPDFFYTNSSLKELRVNLGFYGLMIPSRSVSWTSLKKLSLRSFQLSDVIFAKIISGCPILECLKLCSCDNLMILDLRNSLHLRTLEIYQGSIMEIVAPHIHCLNLTNSGSVPCSLVDVSSLTKARLDIHFCSLKQNMKSDFLRCPWLNLLEKLENVEKLTLGRSFLESLFLADLRGVPFPSLKVKDLTVETVVSEYVIPGLVNVLQNSPELKKLTLHTMESPTLSNNDKHRDNSLQYLLYNFSLRDWSSKLKVFKNVFHSNLEAKHVASFMELMLETTKSTLEKMVLISDGYLNGGMFEELLEMVPSLSQGNNVSIVIIRSTK